MKIVFVVAIKSEDCLVNVQVNRRIILNPKGGNRQDCLLVIITELYVCFRKL